MQTSIGSALPPIKYGFGQDSVAGSVIQASGMVLFEDALKAGTLVVDLRSAASVRTTPLVNLAPHARSHPDPGAGCGGPNGLVLA